MKRSRSLLDENIEKDQKEALGLQSFGEGLSSIPESAADNIDAVPAHLLPNKIRYNREKLKKYITKWIEDKPDSAVNGLQELKSAARDGKLRPGQLIFQEVKPSKDKANEHRSWGITGEFYDKIIQHLTETFATIVIGYKTGQPRDFIYFHVAIYCGEENGKHWVVENGGNVVDTDEGEISLKTFEKAFHSASTESFYFIVSPPKDDDRHSTRYLVLQKALASIGVEYKYHMRAVSCETFAMAMLGAIDKVTYSIVQAEVLSSKRNKITEEQEKLKLEEQKKRFEKFHADLKDQIEKVPEGILLSLAGALMYNRSYPWFHQMVDSYKQLFKSSYEGTPLSGLLNHASLNLSSKDEQGRTALFLASMNNKTNATLLEITHFMTNSKVYKKLLSSGKATDCQDKYGATALHYAVLDGNLEVCKTLLKYKASVERKNNDLESPLDLANKTGGDKQLLDLLNSKSAQNLQTGNEMKVPSLSEVLGPKAKKSK